VSKSLVLRLSYPYRQTRDRGLRCGKEGLVRAKAIRAVLTLPMTLVVLAAGGCGGPSASQAFLDYRKAFDSARSIDEVLPRLAKEQRAKIEATPKEQRAKVFEMSKVFNEILDVKVEKETASGSEVSVEATGTSSFGKSSRGTIVLVKEDGQWKVKSEKWSDDASAKVAKRSCTELAADLKGTASARARAAGALVMKTCPEAVPALAGALKEPVAGIRSNVATALSNNLRDSEVAGKNKAALPLVVAAKAEAARADDLVVEIALQNALGAFGPEAVSHLVPDLKSPSRDLRWGAAARLGRIGAGAQDALPALEAAMKEEQDATVGEQMASALNQIRGQ
jgi:hypothetical protein